MTRKKMLRLPSGKIVKNPYFADRRTARTCPLCGKTVYDNATVCGRCGGKRKAPSRKERRLQDQLNRGYPQPLYDDPESPEMIIEGGYPNTQSKPRPYTGYPIATPHCHYKTCILVQGHEGRHKLRPLSGDT